MDSTVTVACITVAGVAGGLIRDVWSRLRTDKIEYLRHQEEIEQKRIDREKAIEEAEKETALTHADGWLTLTQAELAAVRQERDEARLETKEARAELGAVLVGLQQVVPILVSELREAQQQARRKVARKTKGGEQE